MLNALTHPQTTDINEITRRNLVGSQALSILNSTLLENLSMDKQPDAEAI